MKTLIILVSLIFSTCSKSAEHPGDLRQRPTGIDAPATPTRPPTDAEKGEAHLRTLCKQSDAVLNSRRVMSASIPNLPLTKVIPEDLPKAIIATEHLWIPKRENKETPEMVVDHILSTIGRKGLGIYARTISSAEAVGFAQFKRTTYHLLRRRYRQADLNPSFQAGMKDEVNAVTAIRLYCDSALLSLSENQRLALLRSPETLRRFMLVAYNAGGNAAKRALESGALSGTTNGTLVKETRAHLKKYEMYRSFVTDIG